MGKEEEKINQLRSWEHTKEHLSKKCFNTNLKSRHAYKGSIYLADLGENIGSEINKKRPVIVISNNKFNRFNENCVVLPLTKRTIYSNKNLVIPKYKFHYFLYKSKYKYLNFDSCVKCEQVRTISKSRICKFLGKVSDEDIDTIVTKLNNFFIEN